MANILAKALDQSPISQAKFINQLEELAGFPSEDSRLISELLSASAKKITELGLDPADTSADELYEALGVAYQRTAEGFARAIGERSTEGPAVRYRRIAQILAIDSPQPVWALKQSAIKKVLRSQPPTKLMKHLHYRTIGSMLKREDARTLFAGAWQIESFRWRKLTTRAITKLPGNDIELTIPKVVVLDSRWWRGTGTTRPLVSCRPEVGVVAVWPNQLGNQMTTLGILCLAWQAVGELSDWSMALSSRHLGTDLARTAARLWQQREPEATMLAGHPIAWRSLRHYLGSSEPESQAGWIEPMGASVNSRLSRAHPSLHWWVDAEWLVYVDGKEHPVSFNIIDVALNRAQGLPLAKSTAAGGQRCLQDELLGRYLAHQAVANKLLATLTSTKPSTQPAKLLRSSSLHGSPGRLELGLLQ